MKMFGRIVAHSFGIHAYDWKIILENNGVTKYDFPDTSSVEFDIEPSQLNNVADAVFKSGTLGIVFAYAQTSIPITFGSRRDDTHRGN